MKRIVTIGAILSWISVPGMVHAADYSALEKQYLEAAQHVIDMVNAGTIDLAAVEKEIISELSVGVTLAQDYEKKFPEGKAMLDKVISEAAVFNSQGQVHAIGPMKDQAFKVIEEQWHDGKYFAEHPMGVDLSDENNEHFTDPIHTIVHPVMVYAAAQDYIKSKNEESLKAMKAEMQEGMEQVSATVHTLGQ